jgi:hypothetical protein
VLHSVVGEDVIAELLALAESCPEGCFVEVGVYKGGTAQHLSSLASKQGRSLYLYDTFTGIPYKQEGLDSHNVGDFSDTSFEEVRSNLPAAVVVQGIFPESAVSMPGVAFAHLDCDQYRSVRDSIEYLRPRMVKGGVMWFDDYCLEGAKKAIDETFAAHTTSKTNKVYVRL